MSAENAGCTPTRHTSRWRTRQLTTMAVLVAVGFIISWIDVPIIPGVDFLKYDPSSVAMLIGAFLYGPLAGSVIGTLIALLHGSTAGIWGVLMNVTAMLAMAVPAGLIYRRRKTRRNAVVALVVASVVMVTVNLLANLVVTPIYTGMPVSAVVGLILPALLPFNVFKAVLNSVVTLLLYKSVSRIAKAGTGTELCEMVEDMPRPA